MLEPSSFFNETNSGISILQGPHQVAQIFIKTTFPFKSLKETELEFNVEICRSSRDWARLDEGGS